MHHQHGTHVSMGEWAAKQCNNLPSDRWTGNLRCAQICHRKCKVWGNTARVTGHIPVSKSCAQSCHTEALS